MSAADGTTTTSDGASTAPPQTTGSGAYASSPLAAVTTFAFDEEQSRASSSGPAAALRPPTTQQQQQFALSSSTAVPTAAAAATSEVGGGSAVSASTNGGSFLPGHGSILHAILESFSLIGMHVAKVRYPRWFEALCVLVEWLQVVTFALDPSYLGSTLGSGTAINELLAGLCRLRTIVQPGEWLPVPFYIALTLVLLFGVCFFGILDTVRRGGTGWGIFYFAIASLVRSGRVLVLPLIHLFLSPFTSGQSAGLQATGVIMLFLLVLIVLMALFFISHFFRPWSSWFSLTYPYCTLFIYIVRIVLVLSDVFIRPGFASGTPTTASLAVHAVVVVICALSSLLVFFFTLEYTYKTVAMVFMASLAAFLWSAIMMLVSFAGSSLSFHMGLAIATLVGLGPAAALGIVLVFFRLSQRCLRLKLPFYGPGPLDPTALYPNCKSYELATRWILTSKTGQTSDNIEKMEQLYEEGIRNFPDAKHLLLHYCLFLFDVKHDFNKLRLTLNEALTGKKPPFDVALLLHFIKSSIPRHDSLIEGEEVEISSAQMHHRAARIALSSFWDALANNKQSSSTVLLSYVNDLVHHESLADTTFRGIISRNAASSVAMRLYGQFLEEIKDDKEQAEVLYQEADYIDEQRLRARKRSKKGRATIAVTGVRVEVAPASTAPQPASTARSAHSEAATSSKAASTAKRSDTDVSELGSETHSHTSRASSEGSFFSAGSAGTKRRTSERATLLDYKARVRKKTSTISRVWAIVVFFILMLFFFLTTGSYLVGNNALLSLRSTNVVGNNLALVTMEALNIGATISGDAFFAGNWSDAVNSSLAEMDELWFSAFEEANEEAKETWAEFEFTVTKFWVSSPGVLSATTANITLWDAGIQIMEHTRQLLLDYSNNPNPADFVIDLDRLFLLVNTAEFAKKMSEVNNAVGDSSVSLEAIAKTMVNLILPLNCALFLVSILLAFPGVVAMEREQRHIADLFRELPKSSCVNIHDKMRKSDSQHTEISQLVAGKSMQATRKLFIILVLASLVMAVFCVGVVVSFVTVGVAAANTDHITIMSGRQNAAIDHLQFGTQVLFHPIPGIFSSAEVQLFMRASTMEYDASLAEMDASNLRLLKLASVAQSNLYYGTPCPSSLAAQGIVCNGLDAAINLFVTAAKELSLTTALDPSHPAYVLSQALYPTVRSGCVTSQNLVLAESVAALDLASSMITAFFAISLPVFLLLYVVLYIAIFLVNQVNVRAMSLLLLVPLRVLQKSEAIRSFLENDEQSMKTNVKQILDEQERRTKLIIETCADAILITDEKGAIEMANPATEALLGHQASSLVGTQAVALMSKDSARLFVNAVDDVLRDVRRGRRKAFTLSGNSELVLVAKDGTNIPALASTSMTVTTKGITFATFLRDIRRIKQHEEALELERRKASALLLNVLPADVSEALKQSPGKIIARRYPKVTIMYADLVEFTSMASSMEPRELVELLNGVFSPWDKLCTAHGVEKLRTIGDCYVALAGCPTERPDHADCMLNFTLAMLESLESFNAQRAADGKHPLAFRIGVHSAELIAGVIGFRKWSFDAWGDAVNIANQVQTAGVPNRVQVTAATRRLVKDRFLFENRGSVHIESGDIECFLLSEGQKPAKRGTTSDKPLTSASMLFSMSKFDLASSS